MRTANPRQRVAELVEERGVTFASVSRMIGRNDAYLQQFVKRGTPRRLPELERRHLAMFFAIDERELGAMDPYVPIGRPRDRSLSALHR